MTWQDFQHDASATPPTRTDPAPTSFRRPDGLRRTILTAGIAGALLVTGGVAAVFAATPDPSTTPAPSARTDRSGGTTAPSGDLRGRDGQPCPDKGGADRDSSGGSGGSSGSDGSGGQSAQPSPSTATPAT